MQLIQLRDRRGKIEGNGMGRRLELLDVESLWSRVHLCCGPCNYCQQHNMKVLPKWTYLAVIIITSECSNLFLCGDVFLLFSSQVHTSTPAHIHWTAFPGFQFAPLFSLYHGINCNPSIPLPFPHPLSALPIPTIQIVPIIFVMDGQSEQSWSLSIF